MLAAPLEGFSTFTNLHRRLTTDLCPRYQCEFQLDHPATSIAALSRAFHRMTAEGLNEIREVKEYLSYFVSSRCH
ncbi:hypothetical protein [Melghirimyces profundicolus]|uniref:hypothetical protein n=1 Tax=Melghirimyces profundicolus TaxID=1242148 RepID=UPI003CCC2FE4